MTTPRTPEDVIREIEAHRRAIWELRVELARMTVSSADTVLDEGWEDEETDRLYYDNLEAGE